ncbi:MAG TPA: VTT domain-containing protein [Clostridia bacterium]|nr:VTT domain-containing protein [Clostridia bacterium]
MKNKPKAILKIIILIILVSAAVQWLLPAVTSEKFQSYVEGLGVFAPLVIILYTVVSHVFAPVSGSPGVLLGFAIFGVIQTSVYLYVASLISATINFYIARVFGREWVEKLAGKRAMSDVDDFIAASGRKMLALSRVFGFPIFEVISYAAGLTKMSFKNYFLITVVFSAIPSVAFVVMFRDADFTKPANMFLWVGALIVIGLIFTFVLKRYYSEKKTQ